MSVKELNASESLMTCRKELNVDKTVGFSSLAGQIVTGNCLLVTGQPALRRQELYTTCPDPSGGFYPEREKLPLRCAISLPTLVGIQGILKEADA